MAPFMGRGGGGGRAPLDGVVEMLDKIRETVDFG
jgi:hypothetical protein